MGLPTVPPYTTPEKHYRVFCFKSTVPQGGGYTWIPLWVTGATESQHAGSGMHLKHVSFSTRQILMGCTCLLGEMWNAAVLLSVNTVTPISQKSQLLWYIPRVSVSVGYLLSVAFQASSFFLGGCAPGSADGNLLKPAQSDLPSGPGKFQVRGLSFYMANHGILIIQSKQLR